MTLEKYIKYKEKNDIENFEKETKEKIIDEDIESINEIIKNKFKYLEKNIKTDKNIKYRLADEETSLGD